MNKLLAVSILMFVSSLAWAQVDPVESYLSSAQQKAENVIATAGSQGRGVAMEAGQAVLNAIAAFRAAYSDSLKQTEGSLTREQEELFSKIRDAVNQLNATSTATTADLQRITDSLAAAISQLPFSKDIPRVTRAYPLYTVEGAALSDELVIRGVGLSNDQPRLLIGGKEILPNTVTDSELRFSIPPRPTVAGKPTLVNLTLELFERKTRWLVFSSYEPRFYPIRQAIYPKEIGQVTLVARRRVEVETKHELSTPPYRCESPHGDGGSSVPVAVAPTPGWTIDPASIRYNRAYSNHGAFTMGTTAPAGFTATLSCYGWGRATGLFGVVVDAGSVGVETGTFSYTELRAESALTNAPAQTRPLHWGDTLTFPDLPADTETVLVELKSFLSGQMALEGGGHTALYSLTFNAASKVATLTANSIEDALRH